VDILSVHIYNHEKSRRLWRDDPRDLLAAAKAAAREQGKPLFVGEFGDPKAYSAGKASFVDRMLDHLLELNVDYAAVWTWQFYQKNLFSVQDKKNNRFSLEPGYTDYLNDRIRQVASGGHPARMKAETPDKTAPRVILVWPLECSTIKGSQQLYAVASDDRGKVDRVEFWHGNVRLGVDAILPYEWRVDSNDWPKGIHEVSARAYDAAGNMAAWATRIVVGDAAAETGCTVSFGTGR
jgi:hypothetical protein